MGYALRVNRNERLRGETAQRPSADHDSLQAKCLDQVMSVTRQRHRIVVLLSRRESETAVVERDDAKLSGCQTVEKQGVPQVDVSPKARYRARAACQRRSIGMRDADRSHQRTDSAWRQRRRRI